MKSLFLPIALYSLFCLVLSCTGSSPDEHLIQKLATYRSTSPTNQTEIFYIVSEYDCELCLGHIIDWAENYANTKVIQTGIFFQSDASNEQLDSTKLVARDLIKWTVTHDPSLFELLGASYPSIESPYAIEVFDGAINSIRTIK